MCGPSRIHPEGDGPDHTAHTKRTNTESNERGERRGERSLRGERRGQESMNGAEDQAPSVRPRGIAHRRRARAATRRDRAATRRDHAATRRAAQRATRSSQCERISRGRTCAQNKSKKAGGRCGRWASGGTLRFVIRVMPRCAKG
jgi:hypothetical protein